MNWWPKQSLGGAVLLVVLPVVFIPLAISNIAVQKAVVSTMVHLPKNGSGDKAFFDFSAINKATRKASLLIKHAQPSANSGSHGQLIPVLASTSPLALEPKRTQPTDLDFAQALEPKPPQERKPLSERHASSGQLVIADSTVAQSTDMPEPSRPPKSPPLATPPSDVRPTTNQAMSAAQAARPVWIVQVGSFSEHTNAISLRDKLRTRGYMALVERADVGGKPVFRVIVGPAFERERA